MLDRLDLEQRATQEDLWKYFGHLHAKINVLETIADELRRVVTSLVDDVSRLNAFKAEVETSQEDVQETEDEL